MSKYTITFFQQLARDHDGKCLSSVYTNVKTKMTWKCNAGHIWDALPSSVLYDSSWCMQCRNLNNSIRQLGKIEDLYLIAHENGGKCLSKKYLGVRHKVKWQCKMLHKWDARPADIKRGSWCPVCAQYSSARKKRKYSLNNIKHLASLQGGICLSKKYSNTADKIQLKCKKNHTWNTTANALISGSWCNICSYKKRRTSVGKINSQLKNSDIICLDVIHKNKTTKAKWMCPQKHIWIADLSIIRRKGGCPICSKRKKYTIEDMNELAVKKGGKCLSKKYIRNSHHLQWECANNHKWNAIPRSIIKGSWCPSCNCFYTVNEEKCRFIFQSLLRLDFSKDNQTIKPLELDGHNISLKLAFEYNGEQHYYFINGVHKTFSQFIKQQKRDKQKKLLCKQSGIKLIIIPYTKTQSDEVLVSYIRNSIKTVFPNLTLSQIDMSNFVYIPNTLNELNKIAQKRGGECLSSVYINNKSHLKWKCKNGHIWHTNASTIKRGCWCPECAIDKKKKKSQIAE